jgi:hypothetical protein
MIINQALDDYQLHIAYPSISASAASDVNIIPKKNEIEPLPTSDQYRDPTSAWHSLSVRREFESLGNWFEWISLSGPPLVSTLKCSQLFNIKPDNDNMFI